jgi:hypothetical protein
MSNSEIRYQATRIVGALAAACLLSVASAAAYEGTRSADSVSGATTGNAAEGVMVAQSRQLSRTVSKQTRDLEAIPSQLRRGVDSAVRDLARRQGGTSAAGDLAGGQQPSAIVLLDMICGDSWFVTWLEDEDGNPIPGSHEVHCG